MTILKLLTEIQVDTWINIPVIKDLKDDDFYLRSKVDTELSIFNQDMRVEGLVFQTISQFISFSKVFTILAEGNCFRFTLQVLKQTNEQINK